jgi:phosphate-selective porin OprO and OprP
MYPENTGMYKNKGFWAGTVDRRYTFRITGFVHLDSRHAVEIGGEKRSSDVFWRRARITLDGRLPGAFEYRFMWDNLIDPIVPYDWHLDWRPRAAFNLRVGGFKSSFSLERRARSYALLTIERAFTTTLAPNRDMGVWAYGQTTDGAFSYDVSLVAGAHDLDVLTWFNGTPDFAGRVLFLPFRLVDDSPALQNFGVGFSWTIGQEFGDRENARLGVFRAMPRRSAYAGRALLSYFSGEAPVVAAGRRDRQAVQLHWSHGQHQVLAEYTRSAQQVERVGAADPQRAYLAHQAWQVMVSRTFVDGDENGFFGVYPTKPFNVSKRQWGGFTLTGRYHGILFDPASFDGFADPDASVRAAHAFGPSAQWHVNSFLELHVDAELQLFRGGPAPAEGSILTRIELRY